MGFGAPPLFSFGGLTMSTVVLCILCLSLGVIVGASVTLHDARKAWVRLFELSDLRSHVKWPTDVTQLTTGNDGHEVVLASKCTDGSLVLERRRLR